MKKLTDESIDNYHLELWDAARGRHGKTSSVPSSEASHIGELVRGAYVLQTWQSRGEQGSPVRFLAEYSVTREAVEVIVPKFIGSQIQIQTITEAKPMKRADKWKILEDWAKTNTYQEVSTEKVMEISGFSYPTVLNYIKTSPYFRKIQRGQWEVRDPKADREHEKNL